MRIEKENSLLLIIDVQEKLYHHMENAATLSAGILTLLQGAEALGVPVAAARQYPQGLGDTIEALRPHIKEHYDKITFSCCGNSELLSRLSDSGCQSVIIAGIEAHVCVLQTVIDLKAAGYFPIVVVDAVGSRHRRDYDIALRRMEAEGALLATVESILFELCRESGSAAFKAISRLVK